MSATRRRLATWVVLDGTAYGPHSDLSAEQAARITNPLAWADDPASNDAPAPPAPEPAVLATSAVVPVPPPRAGKGSGVEAWAAFARLHHVEVPTDGDRAAIIEACERAGLIEVGA